MYNFSLGNSKSTAILGLGLIAGAIAPMVISAPATAARFVDVQNHWARPFIETLAEENIISGFSDQTFRPDQTVTRAQLATMLSEAFDEKNVQLSRKFDKEAADYWASRNFASSSSSNTQLRSSDPLSKAQVLVSLINGLRLYPSGSVANTLNTYKDASKIPEYARDSVAAATQKGIVVNYPNVAEFNPGKTATRAEVATFIYQALVNEGVLAPVSSRMEASKYIVQVASGTNQSTSVSNTQAQTTDYKVAKGTKIKVEYKKSDKVTLAPGETMDLTLLVAQDIKNSRGDVLIPKGSEIEGEIIPRYNGSSFLGTQFVAQRLLVGNDTYTSLNATSALVSGEQRAEGRQSTIADAALGTAAQVILGSVLGGGVNAGDILGGVLGRGGVNAGDILGSVLGSRGSNQPKKTNTEIVIDPEKDLQLTLGSDFYVNRIR